MRVRSWGKGRGEWELRERIGEGGEGRKVEREANRGEGIGRK